MDCLLFYFFFFFFNDTATTEIYTLSLHDALPISWAPSSPPRERHASPCRTGRTGRPSGSGGAAGIPPHPQGGRGAEEHTPELHSPLQIVCRLLLEKKKKKKSTHDVRQTTRITYTN